MKPFPSTNLSQDNGALRHRAIGPARTRVAPENRSSGRRNRFAARRDVLVERKVRLERQRRHLRLRGVATSVRALALEMMNLVLELPEHGRNRRHAQAHIQQVSIYLCHVVLQVPQADLARGFGKDFTTISHACARVEDRRDDPAYDRLLNGLERAVLAIFLPYRNDRT